MLAGASTLLALLCLEGVLRVASRRDNLYATATLNVYQSDLEIGWTLRPLVWRRVDWLGRSIVVRTDASGHRVPDRIPTAVDGPVLAFAGDSYTFGNEVQAEETFAFRTGQMTTTPIVNLGVGGYSLDQSCRSLERRLSVSKAPPVGHAFLAIFVGNDIEYGAAPTRPTHVDSAGYLIDSPVTGPVGNLLMRSRVFFYTSKAFDIGRARFAKMRSPREALSYRWIYDEAAWKKQSLDSHHRSLKRLVDSARAADVPLTVLLLPERGQVYGPLSDLPNRKLMALLNRLEVSAFDLLPAMRAGALSDPDLFHRGPAGHFSAAGHTLVAIALVAHLGSP